MNLTEKHKEIRGVRRVAMVAACAALGLATCGSALALSMHVDAASTSDNSSASKRPTQLSVSADVMAGNLVNKVLPVYPADARKARIQGTVVLQAVVGKDGNVENLRVISGPSQLQQSALDAVRFWTYKPFLLNGDPIEVKTTVNVNYSLGK
jgi:TonB family protein